VPGASNDLHDSEDIRLSVTQALWFPILRNLTDLFKDKNPEISAKAIEVFQAVLLSNYQVFGEDLWKEIFG
jgi:hypothetical protein